MSEWNTATVHRIHPPVVSLIRALEGTDCFITGGYARWACSPRECSPKPSDIDVICLSDSAINKAREQLQRDGACLVRETEFSFTYKGYGSKLYIQLLKNYQGGELQDALGKIDFSVCRVALTSIHAGVAHHLFEPDELNSKLTVCYVDSTCVVNTVCRLLRYARKGYDISQLDVIKVLEVVQTSELADAEKVLRASAALSYQDVVS